MAAVIFYSDADEIRCSHFTDLLVDRKIAVREQGKRNVIRVFEIADLECGVAGPDTQQFDFAFQKLIAFDFAKHLIDRGSLPLTEGSVHTEYLNDDDIGLNFWNGKGRFIGNP